MVPWVISVNIGSTDPGSMIQKEMIAVPTKRSVVHSGKSKVINMAASGILVSETSRLIHVHAFKTLRELQRT